EHATGVPQRTGDCADQPIAAERDRDLAGLGGGASQLSRMLETPRALDVVLQLVGAERVSNFAQQSPGTPAAGGGGDDQGDGSRRLIRHRFGAREAHGATTRL